MENIELLMEKYKNELLQFASRAIKQINDENIVYVTEAEAASAENDEAEENENLYIESEDETAPPVYSDGEGSIKIKVFTGNEAFPVMSALVKVLDGEKILFQEFTDQNGMVDEIRLPAPSRTISESPGNGKGYATYRVIVSHPRFNTVVLKDVPVFEGIESIQPVALEPINNNGSETITEVEPSELERDHNA